MREQIGLACEDCGRKNYYKDRNKKQKTDKLRLKKYCRFDRKHTWHKEVKP
ncbi:50S ribosomal protein L33 [PVC group bacterium]|nr:50S ribosomal protein L33 [PVC group bacterium]MCH7590821.1 50S ribosomal protein L33 [PVC group bacterium]